MKNVYVQPYYVLDTMEAEARKLGVSGVAVIQIGMPFDSDRVAISRVIVRMERPADPDRGPQDTGTNYFGVVFSEIAEMISTCKDSGNPGRPLKTGEYGFAGGRVLLDETAVLHIGFSGGTPEQNLAIADAGIAAAGLTASSPTE